MTLSLRQTMRRRLLGLVEGVKAERKLLVVDERALQVVDAVATLSDILDCGVFLVEFLGKRRQPYPSMHAIYLFSPDVKESVEQIVGDYDRPTPLYAHAHLFAINDISSEQFGRLTGCPQLARCVLTVQQVYSDFLATEARAFHFGRPANLLLASISTISSGGSGSSRDAKSGITAQMMSDLDRMARRLLSVWVALGEYPTVRYHRSEEDVLAARLASLLQEYLRTHAERLKVTASTSGSEVIIVSRGFDVLTPLLHDFAYQAMAADLAGIQRQTDDSGALCYSADGGKTTRTLDEGDALWETLRHNHIAKCSDLICRKFNDFVMDNKAAKQAISKSKGGDDNKTTNLEDLKGLLTEMGEFQDTKAMFGLHLRLANECLRVMNDKRLMDVAVVEQNLATAKAAGGEPCKAGSQWPALLDLLCRPNLARDDKVRLAALYAVVTGNVEGQALERAGLTADDVRVVERCRDLGHRAALRRLPQRRSKFDPEPEYDVSRFHPTLKFVLEAAQTGSLDEAEFPRAGPVSASATSTSSSNKPTGVTSLRGSAVSSSVATSALPSSSGNQRIVMAFVIGGLTHAEIKTAYDNTLQGQAATRTDVVVGSTHIVTPAMFLQNVRDQLS